MAKEQGFVVKSNEGRSTTGYTGKLENRPAMGREKAEELRDQRVRYGDEDAVVEPVDADFVE